MIQSNLLQEIGLSSEEQKQIAHLQEIAGDVAEQGAYDLMRNHTPFAAAVQQLHHAKPDGVHEYALDLLFLLACTGYLYEDYQQKGISYAIFLDSMKDIPCKIRECVQVKKVFGTFVIGWYEGFLNMSRFGFGRLQFDVMRQHPYEFLLGNHHVTPNQFALSCHIPSGSPLVYEQVLESYQKAFAFFANEVQGGVLPVFCRTWFFYPRYRAVFQSCSPNIAKFSADYMIAQVSDTDLFEDSWRVFGVDYTGGDTAALARQTKLQRGFIDYINASGGFGIAGGVLLLDANGIVPLVLKEFNS